MNRSESGPSFPVDEATLVAYADGALRGSARRRVELLERREPAVAARAAVYREQRRRLAGLRTALPMEDSLDFHPELVAAVAARIRRHRRTRRLAAAAVVVLGLVGALWPLQRILGPWWPDGERASPEPAIALAEARFPRPDLSAFGLRLVAEANLPRAPVPAIRLVYEDARGTPVYLVFGVVGEREAEALGAVPEGYVALEWRRGALLLALVAPSGQPWVDEVVQAVEQSLPADEPPPPPAVVPAAGGQGPGPLDPPGPANPTL